MSLSLKLSLPPLISLVLVFAVLSFYWTPLQLEKEKARFQQQAQQELQVVEPSLVNDLLSNDLAALIANLDELADKHRGRWAQLQLFDGDGQRLYPLFDEDRETLSPQASIQHSYLIQHQGKALAQLRIELNWAAARAGVLHDLASVRNFYLAMISAILAVTVIGVYYSVIRPLRLLGVATEKISKGDFAVDLPRLQRDEIGQLTSSFQDMMKELQFQQQALNEHAIVSMTDAQGRILAVNDQFVDISGYDRSELVGHTHAIVASGQHSDVFYRDLWSVITQGKTWHGELCNKTLSGKPYWVSSTITPLLNDAGDPERYLSIHTDISARKQAELALLESRQVAEAASQAKSDFLANMSHEIRTPMNAIIGMSDLALQGTLPDKERGFVEKVHRSSISLLGIINDILDFSKIEAGKLDIENTAFDLDNVLDTVANVVGLKAEEKGVELMFDTGIDIPYQLIGDPLRLEQVLINLGSNAVKFTDSGGEILIAVKACDLDEQAVQLRFAVKDSGIGIPEDKIQSLFDSFSQVDASTTRKYGGTGLGLAICKRLVDLMGGEISVSSVLGEGSLFEFDVRLSKQKKQRRWKPDGKILQGLKVLVVDDNASARQILSATLDSFGLDVESVDSGSKAVALLKSAELDSPFDMVVMDWQMPGMDGVAAIDQIQRGLGLAHMPAVIMVTAYGRENARQEVERLRLNVSGYLTKPVNASAMHDAVMQSLGKAHLDIASRVRKRHGLETSTRLGGAKLLLVEDNEYNQDLATELLTRLGIDIVIASNGQEALDHLAEFSFDGVLMDCQMPVMDGYEATRQIRTQQQFSDLPVIAMTANAMVGDKEKVLAVGMNDHIAKPINVKEMVATLERWIHPENPREVAASPGHPVSGELTVDRLNEWVHIDAARGLTALGGSLPGYRKMLLKFIENRSATCQELDQALSEKDFQQAHRIAHTLKGIAGSIGATALQQISAELELTLSESGSDDGQLHHQIEKLSTELTSVLQEIVDLDLVENDIASTSDIDVEALNKKLKQVREMLEDFNVEVETLLQELCRQTGGPLLQCLKNVLSEVERYDFETAVRVLDEGVADLAD